MSSMVQEMLTYGDVLEFVLKYKGKNAFSNMSKKSIETDIVRAMQTGQFLYETDDRCKLVGYLQYDINHKNKILFVYQNVALSLDRLFRFFQEFLNNYPDYTLQAMRHGRLVTYDNNKLLTKLQYYGW